MLYSKDTKIKRNYDFLRNAPSNENLKKNQKVGQRILTRLLKK